ncbi:MAG: LamG-like jellyroll fold domain-containing protein [archaeon]|jgi:uncharacterized repeat protein (TIGR02543 family)
MLINKNNFRAQGTIEYLIIIAIVVVIALVVVSILTGFLGTGSQVGEQSSQLSNWSNLLAITETSVDPDGNYLVRLANNSSDPITISNVQVGDVNVNFSEDLFMREAQNFVVSSNDACSEGTNTTKQVRVTYYTKYGVQKTEIYPLSTFFDCESYSVNLLATRCPTSSGIDTSDATAVDANIQLGETCYGSDGTKLIGTAPIIYVVTFDSQLADVNANPNVKLVISPDVNVGSLPAVPELSGFTFGGWFTETNGGGTEFTADTTVTENITVYAKWEVASTLGDGLLVHYLMNDNEASTVVLDNLGLFNGVASTNTSNLTTDGNINFALAFNGSNYITSSDLGITGNHARSYALWVKSSQTIGRQIMVTTGYWDGLGYASLLEFGNNSGTSGSVTFTGWGADLASNTNISDNAWHHVAFTFDGSIGKIYIDHSLKNSASMTLNTPAHVLVIARGDDFYGGGVWQNFIGSLDDVRIYDRELIQSEIIELAAGTEAE